MRLDRHKWNERFEDRPNTPEEPEPFVATRTSMFAPGAVLDLACGDGATALYLAEQGYEVTGVDISDVALERLETFADRRGVEIETRRLDLDRVDALERLETFENVIIVRYKPPRRFWNQLHEVLAPGGRIFYFTKSIDPAVDEKIDSSYGAGRSRADELSSHLTCIERETVQRQDQHYEGFVFRRTDDSQP